MADTDFVKVAEVGEIPPGDMKPVKVGNEEILLVNVDGNIHACDDVCTHSYASLSEGDLDGEEVQCPLHGAIFNVTRGDQNVPPLAKGESTSPFSLDGGRLGWGWYPSPQSFPTRGEDAEAQVRMTP